MAIPKIIYQTFQSEDKLWFSHIYRWAIMRKNPEWKREFFDDQRISTFFKENFDERVWKAYDRLQIGAAKADFFRYAILYKKGGVYVDLDSGIKDSLDKYIRQNDVAILSRESASHGSLYTQWALIYESGHPFLKRTIEYIVDNIEQNKFPHDVHKMTGPTVYSMAIKDVIKEKSDVEYREVEDDYKGLFIPRLHPLVKLFMYHSKKNRWRKIQKTISVVKASDNEK